MPAIASTDVTVTVERVDRNNKVKRNRVKVVFGNGTLTYPSGGVPLPSAQSFGMRQALINLVPVDMEDAQGIVWKYDFANNKLRGYIQGVVRTTAGAGTPDDFPLDTTADPTTAAAVQPNATAVSVSVVSGAAAGNVYLGTLKEFGTAHAPAAQTLYFEAVGK